MKDINTKEDLVNLLESWDSSVCTIEELIQIMRRFWWPDSENCMSEASNPNYTVVTFYNTGHADNEDFYKAIVENTSFNEYRIAAKPGMLSLVCL